MKRQAKKNGTDMCSNTNKRLKTLIEAKNPLFDFISPTSSLESLIQPFNSKTFLNDYWEKKPLVNLRHGALTKHQHEVLSSIYSTQVLEEAAKEKRLLFGRDFHACRFDGEETVDAVHAKGTLTSASLKKLLHGQKCTFQIHQPQRYSDLLWRLLEHLESYFGCLVGSNVYITPPGTQGLAPHYDDVEVFILQLEGSKHWKLYKPQVELARDYVVNLDPESLGNPIEEFTLRPGDFLYFPRGTIHQACADEGNQFSTHITISTYQHQSYGDYLRSVLFSSVEGLASSSVDFRRGIPLGSISNPVFNSSSLWNEMTSQLGKLTEQLSSHLRKIPFPQPMILDFWSSRLPPFGIDLDEIEGSQPKSPMPDMEDEVRLLYKTHVYFMKQKFQPDERDSEDEEKEEEQVEAIGFYSSIFNSRSDHMIMVEDHSSIENEENFGERRMKEREAVYKITSITGRC